MADNKMCHQPRTMAGIPSTPAQSAKTPNPKWCLHALLPRTHTRARRPKSGIWLQVKTLKKTLLSISHIKGRDVSHYKCCLPEKTRGGMAVLENSFGTSVSSFRCGLVGPSVRRKSESAKSWKGRVENWRCGSAGTFGPACFCQTSYV